MSETNPYEASESQIIDLSSDHEPGNIFSVTQRIGRVRYLAYASMANVILGIVIVGLFGSSVLSELEEPNISPLAVAGLVIIYLIQIILLAILGVRRLHDLDQSGWWYLLGIVPLVNIGLFAYLLFGAGSPGENRYGKKPEPNTVFTWIAGLILPFTAVLGVLAAIAIPAYHDYSERMQGFEALRLAEQIKPAIEQIYRAEDSFTNASNGYGNIPEQISGEFTAYIKVSDGIILAELGAKEGPELAGKQFIVEPVISGDYIVWQCSFTGDPEFAPANCR